MTIPRIKSLGIALIALAIAALASPALAAPVNYEFQAASTEFKAGKGRVISIKLINKRTKQPVEGATFVQTALDMSPENMADTKGKIAADTSTDPNVYRFQGRLHPVGRLGAEIEGEAAE